MTEFTPPRVNVADFLELLETDVRRYGVEVRIDNDLVIMHVKPSQDSPNAAIQRIPYNRMDFGMTSTEFWEFMLYLVRRNCGSL
jgi:hypothetical protein